MPFGIERREGRLSIRPGRPLETAIDFDRNRKNVSDTDRTGREERDVTTEPNESRFGFGCNITRDVSNATRELLYGNRAEGDWWPELADGSWWDIEPGIRRVVDGVPNRTHRLRALGNAVVPQQIYPIFKAIMEVSQ